MLRVGGYTHNSGWEDLSRYYVARDRVPEGPAECVQVDEDDAYDAAGWSTACIVAAGGAGRAEADVEG